MPCCEERDMVCAREESATPSPFTCSGQQLDEARIHRDPDAHSMQQNDGCQGGKAIPAAPLAAGSRAAVTAAGVLFHIDAHFQVKCVEDDWICC